jgi:hypothetical protein
MYRREIIRAVEAIFFLFFMLVFLPSVMVYALVGGG